MPVDEQVAEQQAAEPNTKSYTLTIEASVTVPAEAKEILAHDGRIIGFDLPGGIMIKPWVVFEKSSIPDGDDEQDLSHDELAALGVSYDYDMREFVEEM